MIFYFISKNKQSLVINTFHLFFVVISIGYFGFSNFLYPNILVKNKINTTLKNEWSSQHKISFNSLVYKIRLRSNKFGVSKVHSVIQRLKKWFNEPVIFLSSNPFLWLILFSDSSPLAYRRIPVSYISTAQYRNDILSFSRFMVAIKPGHEFLSLLHRRRSQQLLSLSGALFTHTRFTSHSIYSRKFWQ